MDNSTQEHAQHRQEKNDARPDVDPVGYRVALLFTQSFGKENRDDLEQAQGEKEIERVFDRQGLADSSHLVVHGIQQHHSSQHRGNADTDLGLNHDRREMERYVENASHYPEWEQVLDQHTESAPLEIEGGDVTGNLAIIQATEPQRIAQGGLGHKIFAPLMSAKKPPLRKQSESVSRGAHRIRVPLGFIELRRALIKCINDVVRVRAGIEKTNPKRLPVKGKAVQIKWIPEVALHAPESIGCAIRHFAFFQRMLSVEGAAGDKVRKLDLAGIGGIDSGVFRETEPDVKVSRKGGVSWIQPHDLIQEDTGVDHLLETRVFSRMRFKNSARLDLGFMRSRRWNDLNRRRLLMKPRSRGVVAGTI